MKIYLAGSIAGGREYAEGIMFISQALKEMDHEILTENIVVNLSPNDQRPDRDVNYIVSRDKKLIDECDVFIAEVSQGSHGVGYESKYAEEKGKTILLLRHSSLSGEKRRSAFFEGTGYPRLMFSYYDKESVRGILDRFFDKFFGENREAIIAKEMEK